MRGFVFSIDAMMALLFAFYIISMPVSEINGYESPTTLESISSVHNQLGDKYELPEFMDAISKCGEYTIYDEHMNIVENGKTCECNATAYTYIYVQNNMPYITSIRLCNR